MKESIGEQARGGMEKLENLAGQRIVVPEPPQLSMPSGVSAVARV
jgi:hypothetical protein